MFIDSSAIVEILIFAPKREELILQIELSKSQAVTSATVIYESSIVLSSRLDKEVDETRNLVLEFLDEINGSISLITEETAFLAIDTFARYGKGRHPAKLNFGDCFSYAGAKSSGLPLLYVGNDFALTDLA